VSRLFEDCANPVQRMNESSVGAGSRVFHRLFETAGEVAKPE